MQAIVDSGAAAATCIVDASAAARLQASNTVPDAILLDSLDAVWEHELDGIVLATPSALHAEAAVAALDRGLAVFSQKPVARTCYEARAVVDAARRADRLLGVDMSYRFIGGIRLVRELVQSGELGDVYAVDLVFHNAYGPDKPWFYDPALSGGGCVMDLGVHLVDLALWTLGFPRLERVTSRLFSGGIPLCGRRDLVEDYALARLDLAGGAAAQLACSWNLPAGREAVIGATFYGTRGGAALENVGGSFQDFRAVRFIGTRSEELGERDSDWGGAAAVDWARRLASGARYDPAVEELLATSGALDAIYHADEAGSAPGSAVSTLSAA